MGRASSDRLGFARGGRRLRSSAATYSDEVSAVAVDLRGTHAGDGVKCTQVLWRAVRDGAQDGVPEDHEGRGLGGACDVGAPVAELLEEALRLG